MLPADVRSVRPAAQAQPELDRHAAAWPPPAPGHDVRGPQLRLFLRSIARRMTRKHYCKRKKISQVKNFVLYQNLSCGVYFCTCTKRRYRRVGNGQTSKEMNQS